MATISLTKRGEWSAPQKMERVTDKKKVEEESKKLEKKKKKSSSKKIEDTSVKMTKEGEKPNDPIMLEDTGAGANFAEKAISTVMRPVTAITQGTQEAVRQKRQDSFFENALRAAGAGATVGAAIGAAIPVGGVGFGASVAAAGRAITSGASKLIRYKPKPTTTSAFQQRVMETGGLTFGRVANNAKNFGLKSSYLTKLASTAKNPKVVLGILASTLYTSLFWAPNEKGDALTTLTIAQKTALQNGDAQAVNEINDQIQEVLEISASIPVVGFIKAELAKFKAAAKTSETYAKEAEKIIEEQARIQEQGMTDKEMSRKEDEDYYAKIKEENDAESLRRAEIMQEVWRLRREGGANNLARADELELSIYK